MPPPDVKYQAAQASLATLAAREMTKVWPLLNPARMRATLPDLAAAVAALIQRFGSASASVAADFYEQERLASEATGRFTVIPAQPPSPEQVEGTVRWATRDLWTPDAPAEPARVLLTGVTENLISDVARDTIINNVKRDPKAKGWARIPKPTCCYFCAMLATRGAVYSHETVDFRAHQPRIVNGHTVGGTCQCHAAPVFTIYEPSALIREWQALYRDTTKHEADKINAFRRAYEGRAHTS